MLLIIVIFIVGLIIGGTAGYVYAKNIQKTNLAKMNLPYRTLLIVTADAWADIRVKNAIEPTTSLDSLTPLRVLAWLAVMLLTKAFTWTLLIL